MKSFTLVLLGLFSFGVSAYQFSVNGYLSAMGYTTSHNTFLPHRNIFYFDKQTSNGDLVLDTGLLITHKNKYLSIKYLVTNDDLMDYAFVDFYTNNFGIRVGKVNRLSGFFSGFGPAYDLMNFLPQGDSPLRFSDTFFRFIGAQAYYTSVYSSGIEINANITYGDPVVGDETGLFDPTFFSLFDTEKFDVKPSRRTWFHHFDIRKNNWQFFIDYIDANIKFKSGFSREINGQLHEVQIYVPKYNVRVIKAGIGYSKDSYEILGTVFEQYGKMPTQNNFKLFGQTLGRYFKPIGGSVFGRWRSEADTTIYGGYSYYHLDLNSDNLTKFGIKVPKHIDYQHSYVFGINKYLTTDINTIIELQYNEGTATLSATYQSPNSSKKHWWVSSISLNYVF